MYIATTGKGGNRPATSAIEKANDAFAELRGVKEIKVHIATCRGRRAMRTSDHLQSAPLAMLRELHLEVPRYNKRKGSVANTEDISLFRVSALKKLIVQFV